MGTVTNLRGSAVRPSPVFVGVVGLTILSGLAVWRYGAAPLGAIGNFVFLNLPTFATGRLLVFVFVLSGWILSLCLHEFGHAYLAYRSGDRSQASRGYLTLNPLKYTDTTLSFLIPVLFILLGGIGLPGGAVWIDRGAIPGKIRHSIVSAAGPLANIVFALVLATLVGNLADGSHSYFWGALSFLAFLQVTAALLNLLPIPGLDGFGIVEPYLPRSWVRQANEIGGYVFFALIALLWIPAINTAFFNLVYHVTEAIGLKDSGITLGRLLFQFWRNTNQ
jgi:Zn-dependent protease